MSDQKPTIEFYSLIQIAYEHFNHQLFEGKLPDCMLTAQRQSNVMGYFSADRWVNTDGNFKHEIALNPAYFAKHKLLEVLQTLVHEQCHLWQHMFGRRKSRSGYHNREWSEKMRSIGLIPSSTGLPGGRMTGQSMSDYPALDGQFIVAARALVESGYTFPWVDTEPAFQESCQPRDEWMLAIDAADNRPSETADTVLAMPLDALIPDHLMTETASETLIKQKKRQSKSRYECPGCAARVWGKKGLNLVCGDCNRAFNMQL
ncbi:MAG: SprT-like domain-containing protein [Pseudomonadota bacterium]